jgi:predicted Zn-dependent protease
MKRIVAVLVAIVAAAMAWRLAVAGPTPTEVKLDYQAYQSELPILANPNSRQGKIVAAIAARLEPVVARAYGAQFHYYLTKESDPSAYSYYGPRVYVSVGMVNFARNREELAGVLCHESGHVMHHDGTRSDLLSGSHRSRVQALIAHHHSTFAHLLSMGENLTQLRFSRQQESQADRAGATICSDAGINPWGLVWALELLQKTYPSSGLTYLQDHPTNKARVKALEKYLRTNSQFAMWPSDPRFATPL